MTLMVHLRWGMVAALACASMTYASDKKDSPKPGDSQTVDSGSFGVFVRGQRVVTETFTVQQDNGISIVKSRLQETGSNPAAGAQKSELQMTGSGALVRYEWSDGNGSLVVTPKDEFLLENIVAPGSSKPVPQMFLMPNTSAILDNNFFIHREVLAWRYLATNCQAGSSPLKCKASDEYGVLVPQDRTSTRVRMELVGMEKVTIRGVERELLRLNLRGEEFSWTLWVDDKDHSKLIRVLIADDNTEVLRD